jgi:hypothetical protein
VCVCVCVCVCVFCVAISAVVNTSVVCVFWPHCAGARPGAGQQLEISGRTAGSWAMGNGRRRLTRRPRNRNPVIFTRHGAPSQPSAFEKAMDALLAKRRLKGIWDFEYVWGNCLYEAVSTLSDKHGHSDGQFLHLTAQEVRDRALSYLRGEGRVLPSFQGYLRRAGVSFAAIEQRLLSPSTRVGAWPNNEVIALVGQALKVSIISHQPDVPDETVRALQAPRYLAGARMVGGGSAEGQSDWPQYDMVWHPVPIARQQVEDAGLTPAQVGHFIPCSRLVGWKPFAPAPDDGGQVDLTLSDSS